MRLLLILALCLSTTGCLVSAATTGVSAVNDRQYLVDKANDHISSANIGNTIDANDYIDDNSAISITAFQGTILLAGQAANQKVITKIENIANKKTKGKTYKVVNDIKISDKPISPLVVSNDAMISAKIASKILMAKGINPRNVKVVTENGTVYLLGTVPRDQANIAINIARKTDGVDKVVTLFRYVYYKYS